MIVDQATFTKGLLDASIPAPEGLTNPDGAQATKRYNVYRNNVAVSLSDALEAAFPVIRKLVGDQFFRAMAGVYLRQHPPSSPLMMYYGEAMPDFLAAFEPAAHLTYLPDIARLELAMRQSYHAADAAPIQAEALQALAPDALMATTFRFAPAVHLLRSDFPIAAIYRANTQNGPKPVMKAETALITRPEFDPMLHTLDQPAADCLAALIAGETLEAAIAAGGDALDLGALLGLLLGQGAIIDLNGK